MAGRVIRTVAVRIRADITDYEKKMKAAQKQMKDTASRLESISSKMATVGSRMTTYITAPITAAGVVMAKFAMDAKESEDKFAVSMGSMANEARAWSEQLRKDLGLNSYSLRDQVSTLNIMAKVAGFSEKAAWDLSKGIEELSLNTSSLFNKSLDETATKMKTIFTGETEPLREFGADISDNTVKVEAFKMGLIKQGQEMSNQQKILIRYALVTKQFAVAQDNLLNTKNSPANKLRILGEKAKYAATEIGTRLLPVVVKVIDFASNLLDAFNNLGSGFQNTTIIIAGLAAAMGPIIIVAAGVVSAITTLIGAIAAVGAPVIIVVASIGTLVAAMGVAIAYCWKTSDAFRNNLVAAFQEAGQILMKIGNELKAFWGEWGDELTGIFMWVADTAVRTTNMALEKVKVGLNVINKILNKDFAGAMQGIVELPFVGMDTLLGEKSSIKNGRGGGGGSFGTAATKEATKTTDDFLKSLKDMWKSVGNTGVQAYDKMNDSIREFIQSIKDQTKEYMNFVGIFDKANNSSVLSIERVINRFKGQLRAMQTYQESVAILQSKASQGVISQSLLDAFKSQGVGAAAQLKTLAGASNTQLAQLSSLYGNRLGIASEMAYGDVMGARQKEKASNQIIFDFGGANIFADENAVTDKMANAIINKLRVAGFEI